MTYRTVPFHLHHAVLRYTSDGLQVTSHLFQTVGHIFIKQNGKVGSL